MTGADLAAVFAAALDGGFGPLRKAAGPVALLDRPGLFGLVEDDDEAFITELESFDPDRIDGVGDPANGAPILMLKSAGGRGRSRVTTRVVKAETEKRWTMHLVYPSMRADRAVAADQHRDFAGPTAVESAAWKYLQKGGKVGLWHADGTAGPDTGTVVESWIHRAGDWVIKAVDGSTQTIRDGDWLCGIVWSPSAWKLIKSGQVRGVSMQGSAIRKAPSPEALASLRKAKSAKKQARKARRLAKAAEQAQAWAVEQQRRQVYEQVKKALAPILAQEIEDFYVRLADVAARIRFMEERRAGRAA